MRKLAWQELFPTNVSLAIFVAYIVLFVAQGILVTASQKADNKYEYSIITAVLFTELIKLIASSLLYCRRNSPKSLVINVIAHKKVLALYFVPAFLYCLYNNLTFVNLSTFDPTTYYLLLQLRVVVTGALFQLIFSKKLSKKQWISLLILTCGCMLKQVNFNSIDEQNVPHDDQSKKSSLILGFGSILIFVQIFCSCLAGVYNEYLLKHKGADIDIFIQNIFMYLDSIVCNLVLLALFNTDQVSGRSLDDYFEDIRKLFHYKALLVMLNNAAIGIVTSFFLKNLNSILKTFASALELVLTAFLSYLFFRIPIYLNTVFAIVTVMFAVYLYSQNPVTNQTVPKNKDESSASLLENVEDV